MLLCNWFNRTGALVRRNVIDEELFLRSFGRLVVFYWDRLAPVVALLRRTRGPGEYAGFEFLAARAVCHRQRPARRRTPRGAPSVAVHDVWADAYAVNSGDA